jgi:DNA-binding transcriptional MerR regulator
LNKNVYLKKDFLSHISVSEKTLNEWEQVKLIVPSGYTDDKIPCYSEEAIETGIHIKKLMDLGYRLEEIHRIVKKVGLPQSVSEKTKETKSDQYLTVGNLAEKVGVSPRAIKHWEDKGIIEPDMRSEGGFRLYSDDYIYFCKLIKDLQLFGYSLEEIKEISDYFRDFLDLRDNWKKYSGNEVEEKLNSMLDEIKTIFIKTAELKEGIQRWEDLLKKKKREILTIKSQNQKRELQPKKDKGAKHA